LLTFAKGDHTDVSLWRLRTLICLDWLYPKDKRPATNSKAERIASRIEIFMAPIFDASSDKKRLQRHLSTLCQSAHKLTLNLRRSPYDYEIVIPASGTSFVDEEHLGHGIDGNDHTSDDAGVQFEGNPIAIAMSGTLVKHTPVGRVVMEKASIIMQRF
jgi:hypothetical protein